MTGDYGIKAENPDEWTRSTMAMIKNSRIPVYGALGNNDDGNEYLEYDSLQIKIDLILLPQEILHL